MRNETPYFKEILCALEASNNFLSTLYRSGLFISRLRLSRVVRYGKTMLRSYSVCAGLAHAKRLARFKFNPKFHMLMHVIFKLDEDLRNGNMALNPLSFSCQMPEDFINRTATLSRSVHAKHVALRTIELYKNAVAGAW